VRPVESCDVPVAAVNRRLLNCIGENDEIGFVALPCGTAVRAEAPLWRALRNGQSPDDPGLVRWYDFLSPLVQDPF
jgi:hypothetical protein